MVAKEHSLFFKKMGGFRTVSWARARLLERASGREKRRTLLSQNCADHTDSKCITPRKEKIEERSFLFPLLDFWRRQGHSKKEGKKEKGGEEG